MLQEPTQKYYSRKWHLMNTANICRFVKTLSSSRSCFYRILFCWETGPSEPETQQNDVLIHLYSSCPGEQNPVKTLWDLKTPRRCDEGDKRREIINIQTQQRLHQTPQFHSFRNWLWRNAFTAWKFNLLRINPFDWVETETHRVAVVQQLWEVVCCAARPCSPLRAASSLHAAFKCSYMHSAAVWLKAFFHHKARHQTSPETQNSFFHLFPSKAFHGNWFSLLSSQTSRSSANVSDLKH